MSRNQKPHHGGQTEKSGTRTMDQRRAAHAWKNVGAARGKDKDFKAAYRLEAKRLPGRILAAGLGQALAFLHVKGDDKTAEGKAKQALLSAVGDWVLPALTPGTKERDIKTVLREGDVTFLRLATDEALAYLAWLRRFADAELAESDNAGADND